MVRWIRFPFGLSGDRNAIPDDADPSGEVSFAQGFGPDYELELGVDPNAKPVPRPESNELYFIITDNQRDYQLAGAPPWFPPADNNGVAISYPVNAIVRHGAPPLIYRSLVSNNTVEPGTDPAKWAVDSVAVPASESTAGLVRYATTAEAAARTLTDRAVTPAGLGALYALLLNNPVFPEVLTVNGLFSLSNPANNMRVAAGTSWVHRGIETYTSVQTDLPTVASKTYHLRWTPSGGFALYDLASGSYNPSAVPETDVSFDSTYDNMLIARVVTSAGNAATITPLINKNVITAQNTKTTFSEDPTAPPPPVTINLNFARTPQGWISFGDVEVNNTDSEQVTTFGASVQNRYTAAPFVFGTRSGLYINGRHLAQYRA